MESSTENMRAEWLKAYDRITASLPQRPSSSGASLSQAIKLWEDSAMDGLREVYALACERRNSFALVNTLPVELLARVFEHLAELGQEVQFKRWAGVMLVCRKWRSVALGTPSLWATISLNSVQPLDIFLERYRKHPLSVTGNVHAIKNLQVKAITHLLQPTCLLRLKEFELTIQYGADDDSSQVIPKLFSTDAPQLESLKLDNWKASDIVSRTFISTQTPRLERIVLRGYIFPWGARCHALRRLSVRGPKIYNYNYPYTFENVLETLSTLTALETLSVDNCLPQLSADERQSVAGRDVLSLPCLVSLDLREPSNACWVLWALLQTHPSASVCIVMNGGPSIPLITKALSRQVHCLDSPTYIYLKVVHHMGNRLRLCYFESIGAEKKPGIQLHIDDPVPGQSAIKILRAGSLQDIYNLEVEAGFGDMPFDDVVSHFTAFTSLRCLVLSSTPAVMAFSSLLFPSSVMDNETVSVSSVPVPELEELYIGGASLTSRFSTPGGATIVQPIGMRLCRALKLRNRAGFALSLLKVERCELRTSWVQAWKVTAREVHWHRRGCYCADGTYQEEKMDTDEERTGWEEENVEEDEDEDSGDDYIPPRQSVRGRGRAR